MTDEEIAELTSKSREDGARLYSVSDAVYKVLLGITGFVALVGVFATIAAFVNINAGAGFAVLIFSVVTCGSLYAGAIFSTHVSKVLVHLLFSNLAILSRSKE